MTVVNPLPIRRLGDLEVPAIGYGAMVLSPGMYGAIDDDTATRTLNEAVDAGAWFVDSSDGYGANGHNETLIGRALRARRDEVVIATKFGFLIPNGEAAHRFPVGYAFGELAINASPHLVRGYALDSLRRLNTDYIDLYYPHFPDPEVPLEDTVGAVAELVQEGIVRHIGLSNVTAEQFQRAAAVHPIAAVQTEWSMWASPEQALLDAIHAHGAGIVAWSPLGGGFLTGGVQQLSDGDFRHNAPRFSAENLQHNNDRFAPIRAIAADLGITPGQLALAWLLETDDSVVPIPGSRTPAHITENLDAARIELHPDTLAQINEALAQFHPAGGTLL